MDSVRSWPLRDRLGYYAAWGAGLALIAIAGTIVAYMAYRGAQYFDLGLFFESPNSTLSQAESGGFKDPLYGTALLLVMSTLIAAPLGVTIAVWLNGSGSNNCCIFRGGPFTESHYFGEGMGIAVKRGNETLRRALNYGLFRLWEKGTYTDLYLRYFPISFY